MNPPNAYITVLVSMHTEERRIIISCLETCIEGCINIMHSMDWLWFMNPPNAYITVLVSMNTDYLSRV